MGKQGKVPFDDIDDDFEYLTCGQCHKHFFDEDELERHRMDAHWYCEKCDKFFSYKRGLNDHKKRVAAHPYYCTNCQIDFPSEGALRSHTSSKSHKPRKIHCPHRDCDRPFIQIFGLISHLESGACPSGITHRTIERFVHEHDKTGLITEPMKWLVNSDGGLDGSEEEPRFIVTRAAFNGSHWECYLCHKHLKTSNALESHVNSPRHLSPNKIYICPSNGCQARFNRLSYLCHHIEDERCGVHRFEQVQKALELLTAGVRMLAV